MVQASDWLGDDQGPDGSAPLRAAARLRRALLPRRAVPLLAVAGLAACAAYLIETISTEPPVHPADAAVEVPAHWAILLEPAALIDIAMPALASLPRAYGARQHTGTFGREDSLIVGTFGSDDLHLRFNLARPGAQPEPERSFHLDLVRRAALVGIGITRSAQPAMVETKFGPLEVADVVMSESGRERGCLAFRQPAGEPMRLTGWRCEPPGTGADAQGLVCAIEALQLAQGVTDIGLREVFAKAAARVSPACAAQWRAR